MKFLLKILVFVALILISKYTREDVVKTASADPAPEIKYVKYDLDGDSIQTQSLEEELYRRIIY